MASRKPVFNKDRQHSRHGQYDRQNSRPKFDNRRNWVDKPSYNKDKKTNDTHVNEEEDNSLLSMIADVDFGAWYNNEYAQKGNSLIIDLTSNRCWSSK
jgi:hypothetical protein